MDLGRKAGSRRSEMLLARARRSVAGGDSSSMRVLPYHPPLVVQSGQGSRIRDVDGNDYLDLNIAYGPLLFGHRPPFVIDAVVEQITQRGSILGFPQTLSFEVAEKIQLLFPSMELMRFANSGTEAVASSIRLARAVTGRRGVMLFEGHYHGWSDAVFHCYHAGLDRLSEEPGAPAIPGTMGMNGAPHDAWLARFNHLDSVRACFDRHGDDIAAVILEPVMGNAGVIPPEPGFLEGLREITQERGALLVFDEVITGLRIAPGGAQQRYAVRPDLTILSKALGGGFPIAAFGGAAHIMERIVSRDVFHGGVYSGNAAVLAAANAVLTHVIAHGQAAYDELEVNASTLTQGAREIFRKLDVPCFIQHVGPMITILLTTRPVAAIREYRDALRCCDQEGHIRLQKLLLEHGLYIHPNPFEPQYLSFAHSRADIDLCVELIDSAARVFSATHSPA